MQKLTDAKEELERLYGIKVLPVQADVSAGADNKAVVDNVVKQAIDTFGRIDVLINNAQASASGVTLADHTQEQFDLAMYSGLYAVFYYMQAFYPYLKETKGSVINFASGAGLFGNYGQCLTTHIFEVRRCKLYTHSSDLFLCVCIVTCRRHLYICLKCIRISLLEYMSGETLTLEGGMGQRP